ncbi:MAG: long-chain fatty acid--CoA ligase [Bacillota bacterium]
MMMDYPLLVNTMLMRCNKLFAKKEIVSVCLDSVFRYTYGDFFSRVCRLANLLQELGIKKGDVVGTFAWNTHRHMEIYFAVTCSGAILHTINVRLHPDHLSHIINHAEDKLLFVDDDLMSSLEIIGDKLSTVQSFIVLTDKEYLPQTKLANVFHYERLLKLAKEKYVFPRDLGENTPAAICYTSATTGLPKGVRYTHRSIFLHALTLCTPDAIGISERDVILAVVPMFHVFSWGFPFCATLMGSKLILPGRDLSAPTLCRLIETEKVTLMAGVPTIWINLYQHLESGARYDLNSLRYILNGGSPISKALVEGLEKKHGLTVRGTCGMTEATPVVLTCPIKSYMDTWDEEKIYSQKAKQGMLLPGLEMKVVSKQGEVSHDGREMGELLLRGPWIAAEYYKDPARSAEVFIDGWYHTGDIVTVDDEGYILVKDRSKDIIKSGGEWISSVDLENTIMGHPAVIEAAVIGIPHEKWQERPLAYVVLKESEKGTVTELDILNFLKDKTAKWSLPDKVLFIDEVPKTSVGKFNKKILREMFVQGK